MVSQVVPKSLNAVSIKANIPDVVSRGINSESAAEEECEPMDVTVAIPTYNGAKRLPLVLDRLQSQIGIDGISWEVIVCDNNSTDSTADVIRGYQQRWPKTSTLKYGFAAVQGAARARQRAVQLAQGKFIAFLDDDNLPAQDWVKNAFNFGQCHPKAGAFGSQIHGKFATPPPEGFRRIASYLAIVERGNQPHRYEPKTKILPPGAGLVVRRQAWLESVPEKLFLDNKGKGAGLASEDLEAALHIQKAGWEVWYNSDMVVEHLIPDSRLQLDYLKTLLRCVGLSRFYIRMLGITDWQRPLLAPAYIANDLRRLALHWIRHGSSSKGDWVVACEREHLTSSVISPLFLLEKAATDVWKTGINYLRSPGNHTWLHELELAFEQDKFCLYKQDIIAIQSDETGNQIAKASAHDHTEVLLRLLKRDQNNNHEAVFLPNQFLPTAAQYGLTLTLDRLVIRKFFETHARSISQDTVIRSPLVERYAINISTASVCDEQFIDFISDQISRYSFPPDKLCFEISASTAFTNLVEVSQFANAIRELGCQVTIDDIISRRTLNELFEQKLPIGYLKLSRTLVQNGQQQPERQIKSIIEDANRVGITSIATGVETEQMLQLVKNTGVCLIQGYRFSRPKPLK